MKVDFAQVFTQIIAFLIMLWILKRYAWKPILELLDARKAKIQSEFDAIEVQKKENEKILEQYQGKLKDIEVQSRASIQEAKEEASKLAHKIQTDAQEKAKEIFIKAQDDVQREIAKAKNQLKDEIVTLSLLAAEKTIKSDLTKKDKEKIVSDFVKEVKPIS